MKYKCSRCKQPKTKEEMYHGNDGIRQFCNICSIADVVRGVKNKKRRREVFLEKWNRMKWVSK